MKHAASGPALGLANGPRQIDLHDQAGAALCQAMAYETQHCPGAGCFLNSRVSGPVIETCVALQHLSPHCGGGGS